MSLTFTAQTTSDGVVDRSFTVGSVPGVLWSPVAPAPGAPLVLMGHGGGLHKRAPGLVARAHQAVRRDGFHVAAVDAPGHGDRPRSPEDQQWVEAMQTARRAGKGLAPVVAAFNASLAARAVPEWRTSLDALLALPEVGDVPVGYSGMTLASAIGLPLAVAEPRIRAAVFGGVIVDDALLAVARSVTIPLEFLLPWDDPEIDRAFGLAVFDAFGSSEKVLHAFPGPHARVPGEAVDTRFFVRQLGRGGPPPVLST